jgi:hypothetical protein
LENAVHPNAVCRMPDSRSLCLCAWPSEPAGLLDACKLGLYMVTAWCLGGKQQAVTHQEPDSMGP